MIVCNVGFLNKNGREDETQLNIEERNRTDEEVIELVNLLLSLKDELGIKEVFYIDYMECEQEEE